MRISLKNYTLRHLMVALLVVIAIWALIFYAFILDEVYDNVDDGLKNQKIEIIRAVYEDPSLLKTDEYGINQFVIRKIDDSIFDKRNYFQNQLMYMPYDDDMEPYRILTTHFYSAAGTAHQLEIRASTVEEDDLLADLATALIVLYVFIIISIFLINHYVLRRALSPFQKILKHLQEYKFGEVDTYKSVETDVKELEHLNSEIISMIGRNEKIFEEQKHFIENASHELQTPLAITVNKLELLLDNDSLTEEVMIQIAQAKDSLLRMVNLNRSLLMMSRIDNMQYRKVSEINFNTVTQQLSEEMNELIEFKNIRFTVEVEGLFMFKCNEELVRILLSNLIRNAIKYTPINGSIKVVIGDNNWLIANSAIGPPLAKDLIFKRFKKGNQDKTSNGLGLAIVLSIIETYPQLTIDYSFDRQMHLFSIQK